MSTPRSNSKPSTLRNDSGKRTYIITTNRIISGDELKQRRRFGYRRLAILLRREGKGMNRKKVYRLYREERLTVRKRGGRKRALGTRAPMAIPQEANQR